MGELVHPGRIGIRSRCGGEALKISVQPLTRPFPRSAACGTAGRCVTTCVEMCDSRKRAEPLGFCTCDMFGWPTSSTSSIFREFIFGR